MRYLRLGLVAIFSALLSGCATLNLHFGGQDAQKRTWKMGDAPRYVYAGMQSDFEDVLVALPGMTSGNALYDGFNKVFFFVPLLDLPLSVVADTLFLPYDVYKVTIGGQTRYGQDR